MSHFFTLYFLYAYCTLTLFFCKEIYVEKVRFDKEFVILCQLWYNYFDILMDKSYFRGITMQILAPTNKTKLVRCKGCGSALLLEVSDIRVTPNHKTDPALAYRCPRCSKEGQLKYSRLPAYMQRELAKLL